MKRGPTLFDCQIISGTNYILSAFKKYRPGLDHSSAASHRLAVDQELWEVYCPPPSLSLSLSLSLSISISIYLYLYLSLSISIYPLSSPPHVFYNLVSLVLYLFILMLQVGRQEV